ncbi:DUF6159 family protein [Pseudomarimonas arenosa]|nr:DUF6159 family protein [Pseudomarimonas arenosa]
MGRFARSWALIKASAGVLRSDTELLVFPLLSSIATLMVVASFVAPLFVLQEPQAQELSEKGFSLLYLLWFFGFYLCQYFIIFFFNSALVGAAMIRLQGGDPTLSDGLRIAWSKVGVIFGYAMIAATVGMILRAIEQRAGFIGSWIAGLFGAAWTVASFLVVPILVSQNIGPIEAVKRSAMMLKQSWGENLIGNGGIGLVGGFLTALVLLFGAALTVAAGVNQLPGLAITLGALTVVAALLMGLIQAALSGIYSAALYRYADGGESQGFDRTLLQGAFAHKG